MENIEISIKLDPVKDGFKETPDTSTLENHAAVIVGTNGKHRCIGDMEVIRVMQSIGNHGIGFPIGDDYVATIDERKILKVGASKFFVGSMMVMKCSGICNIVGENIFDTDIEKIKGLIESRIVTLSTGTEEFSAYQLEY